MPVDASIEALQMLGLVVLRLLDALLRPLERIRDYVRADEPEPSPPTAGTPGKGANMVAIPSNAANPKVPDDGARAAMRKEAAATTESRTAGPNY